MERNTLLVVVLSVMTAINMLGAFFVGSYVIVVLLSVMYLIFVAILLRSRHDGWMRYYEHAKIPIIEFMQDGRIINCNSACRALIDSEGNFFRVAKPLGYDEEFLEWKQILASNTFIPREITLTTKPNYVAIVNIIKNSYSSNRILCFMTDITELKNLELQFYHSQKMQAIGQLAGGIAHDFNNIMTTVLGVCDLLLIKHTPADQSFVGIKQIQQNAIRAINLVKQLLAFSRKQILQPSLINISETLDELSNNLIRRLIGENISLKLQLDRDLWTIKADESQFEQVIVNLAVNSRDAMPNGGELVVRTRHVIAEGGIIPFMKEVEDLYSADADKVKDGEYIMIEVSDTGLGIPTNQIAQIFDPFYSTKPLTVGSGLGLSTVYGIVKQTGGYIYVRSEMGLGTSFYILFKSAGLAAEDAPKAREKVLDDGLEPIDLTGTETIMVVEDEPHVRSLCVHALQNKGYNVLEAESCEVALDMFRQRSDSISLIITDIVMSGMNGSDLAMIAEKN